MPTRTFEEWTRILWNASYFIQRGDDQDRAAARQILQNVASNAPGPIAGRASALIEGTPNVN